MSESSGHLNAYLRIPLVGEFCFEWGGVTRGRYPVDALVNDGGFEVWAGRAHVIVDPAKNWRAATVAILIAANLLPLSLDKFTRSEMEPQSVPVGLLETYPT